MASVVTFALHALVIGASLKITLGLLDPGNSENKPITALFLGIVVAVTLQVGGFLPFIGVFALLMILVSFYDVAFVRSFLVVIVMVFVAAQRIITPVHAFLGV